MAYYFYMRYVLGFDGGGTKTECVLMDEEKNVVAPERAGASNPARVGFERAVAMIEQAAKSAISEAGVERSEIAALCAGIAGAGDAHSAESLRARLAAAFPGMAMKVCTDLDILLAAAGEGPAMVLIAGTGSAAAARRAADLHPRFFPVMANAADAGDEMAQELLRNAASDLAALVKQLVDEPHFRAVPFHLAKTGGTIGRCAFFDVELEKRRREAAPKATIGLPAISPAHAAALMALELMPGRELTSNSNG